VTIIGCQHSAKCYDDLVKPYPKGKKYPNRYREQGMVTREKMKLVNIN